MLAQKPKTSATKEMEEARMNMLLTLPFFGSIVLDMEMEESTEIEKAWTDGKTIKFNPEFHSKSTFAQKKWTLAGLTTALAMKHHTRRGDRDEKLWQLCSDIVVYNMLQDSGLEIPDDLPFDRWEATRFSDKSITEIYDILYQEQPPPPGGGGEDEDEDEDEGGQPPPGGGEGGYDDIGDAVPSGDPADVKEVEKEWDNKVQQAINMQKRMGKGGTAFERIVQQIKKDSEVDWRKELRNFVEKITKGDYSWSMPNRRYLTTMGIYLPALHAREIGKIVIAIDTSGSITDRELQQFEVELNKIFSEFPTHIYVIYCDDEINHVDEFTAGSVIKLNSHGGGGTDFIPVFEYVHEKGIKPECLIYFTDCYGDYPSRKPSYPTLWGSTTDYDDLGQYWKPKFGKFVRVRV